MRILPKDYSTIDMGKVKRDSQLDNWDDDFDRARKRKSTKKSSDYKRKEKYKNNYFDNDY
jgi:hypothetical protein